MALKANNTAISLIRQSARNVFADPSGNLLAVSNVSLNIAGVTIANDEYTGSVHKQGDEISGKNATLSYDVNLRGPGGTDVPADGAFLIGLLLTQAKMTEVRVTPAIPGSPEPLGGGSTASTLKFGTSALATPGVYKGLLISLPEFGSGLKSLMGIRSNAADKTAILAAPYPSDPSGNYQFVRQLAYVASITESDVLPLSQYVNFDGKRFALVDCVLSSLRLTLPVSTRDQAALPKLSATFNCQVFGEDVAATPAIPSAGPVPKFKDGKFYVAGFAMGGSSMSLDFGIRTAAPPNPNYQDGSEASELIEIKKTLSLDTQAYRKDQIDTLALADAQAQHPVFALYGNVSGNAIGVTIPDGRLNYRSPQSGGEWITENGDMFIDVFDRNVAISFPYFD